MPPKRHLLPDSHSESSRSSRIRLEEGFNQPVASTSDHAKALWSRVRTALRGLEKSSSVLAPLKSGIDVLVNCITELPEADKRRQEFCDLAESLVTLSETLTEHIQTSSSAFMSKCVTNIVNAIQQDINDIKHRQRGNRTSLIGSTIQEEEDLIRFYRRIESHFRQLLFNATLNTLSILDEQLANSRLDRLHQVSAATYNSAQSSQTGRDKCSPNTRAGVLGDLNRWATCLDSPKLYWMNGMAGTGKTTISCSLSHTLESLCLLGASFFCSRILPDCRDVSRIVPTIAYQLARFSLPFQSALCRIIGKNPDVANCGISDQFERLILDPLLEVKAAIPANVVVVIDALDECSATSGTAAILDWLFIHATELPVKFFITSRPEPSISDRMIAQDNHSRSMFVLHDIEASIVQADIETYLTKGLADLSPPPSTAQLQQLAWKAGSLFIYAATILHYICPQNSMIDSHDRLNIVLGMASTPHSRMHSQIDGLYSTILTNVVYNPSMDPEEIERIQLVLHTVICVMEPITTRTMSGLLGLDEYKVELALKPLHSVVKISASHGVHTTLHASFPDYMLDRGRSEKLFCDREKHSGLLAQRCLEVMNSSLRFNICGLESSFDLDDDVPNLPTRVDEAIPLHLSYACCYWAHHLVDSKVQDSFRNILALLTDLLSVKMLFWMEVLNLRKRIHMCFHLLSQACLWLQKNDTTHILFQLCKDAQDFSTMFIVNPVSDSTPHLYVSALPFCDRNSTIWTYYGSRAQGLASVSGSAVNRRLHVALAACTTQSQPNSIAYSPDHTPTVSDSDSDDHTIRIRNAQTEGTVVGPFEEHTYPVLSVAFSPDGAHVVSGSADHMIRTWDAQSGSMVAAPLEGHTNWFSSVAFSPDGTCAVSGSLDCMIRVWDGQSGGTVARPLKGHTDWVMSVAFSPDGARVVSGSHDCTIRIWDAQSGSLVVGPLEGHTDWVRSVAFSPDGAHVVSGSRDRTIRIWDAQTGNMVAGPFEGHADSVMSVAFSPDGVRVVSGSHDRSIRIWDTLVGNETLTTSISRWRLNTSGWIMNPNSQRMLWIPPALRAGLKRPQNTLVIHPKGYTELCFDHALVGKQWRECFL